MNETTAQKVKIPKELAKIIDDLNAERESVAKKIKGLQNFILDQDPVKSSYTQTQYNEICTEQIHALQKYYEKLTELITRVNNNAKYNEELPKGFKSIVLRD